MQTTFFASLPRLFPVAAGLVASCCVAVAQATVEWTAPDGGVMLAVDSADNVYTVRSNYNLGDEIDLLKHDAQGNLVWITSHDQTDATKWEAATWVATDSQDNVLVIGTLKSGYSNPVDAASIAMKFAPSGQLLWRRVYESGFDGSYTVRGLVDEQDNVYVIGVGSGPPGFVTKVKKFDSAGATVWTYYDAAGIGAPLRAKLAPDGDILIVGRGITGSLNGYQRIDRDGNVVWSVVGIPSLTTGDAAGDVFGNTYHVDGEYAANGGSLVTKRGPTGAVLWQNVYPSVGRLIEIGNDDRPVICGYVNAGGGGSAFFKLQTDGQLAWANLDADGPSNLLLQAQLLLDASNDAYLAASTLFDMAVCKVRADGASAWTALLPGSYAYGIALGRATTGLCVVGGRLTRLRMAEEGRWTDRGQALAGSAGTPRLAAEGPFVAGPGIVMHVERAMPVTVGIWVAGGGEVMVPVLGGVLVPNPDVLLAFVTDAHGRSTFEPVMPAPVPVGAILALQAWLLDPAGPAGFAASNGTATVAQ